MPIIRALPVQLHSRGLSKYSVMKMGATVAAATAATSDSLDIEEERIGVMFIILFVSLFAVSFPTLSKQIRFLRIPGIHFGTGVILATAFIHLLDDAFRSLADRKVEERYGKVSKWTGSIILVSLLAIFLVEYTSTSFVEHLNGKSSTPSTPVASQVPSRRPSLPPKPNGAPANPDEAISEITPLLNGGRPVSITIPAGVQTYHAIHSHTSHSHTHHTHQSNILTNSPRVCRMALTHEHTPIQIDGHKSERGESYERALQKRRQDQYETEQRRIEDSNAEQRPRIGRRRQIVGLLVSDTHLRLMSFKWASMIHSFVIGLTLSVTSGSDFTSLTTAIIFHQLFEGFSLGIRIAAIPPKPKSLSHSKELDIEDVQERLEDEIDSEDSEEVVRAPPRHTLSSSPQVIHSHRPSIDKGKHKSACSAPSSTLLYSPKRSSKWQPWKWRWRHVKEFEWLKLTLTSLFGVTTPLGMALGMLVWNGPGRNHSSNDASMLLTQGIMSAISAGLLIYAATVEMIAGDFVFGDVEGHHHHHHHTHEEVEGKSDADASHSRGRKLRRGEERSIECEARAAEGANVELRMEEDAAGQVPAEEIIAAAMEEQGGQEEEGSEQGPRIGKRVLAVLSLFAGAGMMVLVGLGEGD
ncbi:ZIP zinc transporter-domain-containing protein [Gymnopilus junonius]|uniref:ZIP zinc transporter-domain-containing protein n=1 Tax=Gymnopilus junonius TaxID=109634 RepID=A0A9P5TH35_GYMJU|nr:ZIP zinc transporter-domain-containing protein [Gymnopilus junonius]